MSERFFDKEYKYPVKGESIVDLNTIIPQGVLYELRCTNKECELSVRTQGVNVQRIYRQFIEQGCPSCTSKGCIIKEVDIQL